MKKNLMKYKKRKIREKLISLNFQFVDEENEQQVILNVNEPIDAETEYPCEYFFLKEIYRKNKF